MAMTIRQRRNIVIRARRADWLAANGPCKVCGSWENLHIDHIKRSTKDPRLSGRDHGRSKRLWEWSTKNREAELAKCQVLCSTHHYEKTAQEMRKG